MRSDFPLLKRYSSQMKWSKTWCILRLLIWIAEGIACLIIQGQAQREYPSEYNKWPHADWITVNVAACIVETVSGSFFILEALLSNKVAIGLWIHAFVDLLVQIGLIMYIPFTNSGEPIYIVHLNMVLIVTNLSALGCDSVMLGRHYHQHNSYRILP